MPSTIDWSATAAWIALIISVVGSVAGPIISSIITNLHDIKMFDLKAKADLNAERQRILIDCISGIGAFLSQPDDKNLTEFGRRFHVAYAYVPVEKWKMLDDFYVSIASDEFETACRDLPKVIHLLSGLLKEELPAPCKQ